MLMIVIWKCMHCLFLSKVPLFSHYCFFFRAKLQWSRKNGKKKNENRKMKTPVYDGEEGKISPSCPIWEPTLGVSMLLEKAALRRLILPAVLRELFLTGCALTPVVLAHCEEKCCCLWSHDSTAVEVACPKSDLRIRLATQRECCVTSTSMRCLVFSGLRLRQTRRNSCPSSHNPPMLVKMNGRQDDSVRRRPCSSLRG